MLDHDGASVLSRETCDAVIFDLDGVVYRGAEPIPGAAELVAWLHAAGAAVRFALGDIAITPRIGGGIAGRGVADRWNFDTILLTSYLCIFRISLLGRI